MTKKWGTLPLKCVNAWREVLKKGRDDAVLKKGRDDAPVKQKMWRIAQLCLSLEICLNCR